MAKRNNKTDSTVPERRLVILPDIHFPLHDERALTCVEGFMLDFKPTHVVYSGDGLQMDSVSHWLADKRRSLEGQRLLRDYDGFAHRVLDRHRDMVPDAEFVYILGNHEDWVRQYIDLHPEMEGMLEVEMGLRLRERGISVVDFGQTYHVGKLWIMHGIYLNEHHAKSTALAYRRNIRYGHTHDIQHFTISSPIDVDDRISAGSVGCLCNVNPQYLRNKPNRWQHGFCFAYIRPDGNFTDYTVQIIDGKFSFGGKTYSG